MSRPKIKDTPEYIEKQELFWHNLFEFFLGLIQRKLHKPPDPQKDTAMLGKILDTSRMVVTRWRDKEHMPVSEVVYLDIVYRLLVYLNIPQFPIEAYHLYNVDCDLEFGDQIRKAINLPNDGEDILRKSMVSEHPEFSIPEKLRQLVENQMEMRLLNITKEEISVLSRVRFPEDFRITSELYKYLLAYYRGL